jgi:copper resistance protein B
MMNYRARPIAAVVLVLGLSAVQAQEPAAPAAPNDTMESMPGMDHSQKNHDSMPAMDQSGSPGAMPGMAHDMGSMDQSGGMQMGSASMQGGPAPANARDPHAYSDGYDFGPLMPMHMSDQHNFAALLVDRLESVRARDNRSAAYDLHAWYGRTYDRAVLKAEGDVEGGVMQDARTELLWGHAVATYWDTQLGVRYDSGIGPVRGWLAFGIEGLAPYWFELEATA